MELEKSKSPRTRSTGLRSTGLRMDGWKGQKEEGRKMLRFLTELTHMEKHAQEKEEVHFFSYVLLSQRN